MIDLQQSVLLFPGEDLSQTLDEDEIGERLYGELGAQIQSLSALHDLVQSAGQHPALRKAYFDQAPPAPKTMTLENCQPYIDGLKGMGLNPAFLSSLLCSRAYLVSRHGMYTAPVTMDWRDYPYHFAIQHAVCTIVLNAFPGTMAPEQTDDGYLVMGVHTHEYIPFILYSESLNSLLAAYVQPYSAAPPPSLYDDRTPYGEFEYPMFKLGLSINH